MKMMKKILKWIGVVSLIILVMAGGFYFMYIRPFMQHMKQTNTVQYDKDLTLVLGGGGNSGILVSDSLVLVIDTKMDEAAEQLAKQVKDMAGNKPILVVNTHYHSDHSSGNKFFNGASILVGGNYTKEFWEKEVGKENLPTIWLKDKMDVKMGDDTATIFNLGKNVHTASDVMVYLHKRKMLFGGDVILNKQVPAIMGVADPYGYVATFEMLPKNYDIKTIVPGHGPIGGMEVIENFKGYFNDMILAAADGSKKDQMIEKYDGWAQVPVIMSPGATIKAIEKKMKK